MKKLLVIGAVLSLLSGCATLDRSRDINLNSINGVILENNGSYEIVKSYSKEIIGSVDKDKLKVCITRVVSNDDVRLSDSASSFTGAYTGNYYHIEKSSTSRGGDVINTGASSENIVVANGTTSYFYDAGLMKVERIVRFNLDIESSTTGELFTFTNIKQAQKNSGTVQNDGFSPIGSWAGAGPIQAIQQFDKLATEIHRCASK
ncbi:hypothetical protein [Providencia manganoxydans]